MCMTGSNLRQRSKYDVVVSSAYEAQRLTSGFCEDAAHYCWKSELFLQRCIVEGWWYDLLFLACSSLDWICSADGDNSVELSATSWTHNSSLDFAQTYTLVAWKELNEDHRKVWHTCCFRTMMFQNSCFDKGWELVYLSQFLPNSKSFQRHSWIVFSYI